MLFFWSLFGALKVKDGLYRAGKKTWIKMAKNCMYWNVDWDVLPWICNNWTIGLMADKILHSAEGCHWNRRYTSTY